MNKCELLVRKNDCNEYEVLAQFQLILSSQFPFTFFFLLRLNTTKKNLLDAEGAGSVAVRMALGETELVSETREFLESHGVKLDVFGQVFIPLICECNNLLDLMIML